jgi:hypothetical protein
MTSMNINKLISKYAAKGGRARASVLTDEEKKAIARSAARARWDKFEEKQGRTPAPAITSTEVEPKKNDLPFSMFKGRLTIGNVELECHVLNDLRRVFTQREVVRVLTGGRESGNLQTYLDANPLVSSDFRVGAIANFKVPGNPTIAIGYEATILIEICEKYLEARDQNLLKKSQLNLAKQAEIITRSCAKVGIIALVDEATGYQAYRKKQELQLKLQAFITDEMQEWAKMFPDEFWFELARLEGVHYSPRSRPLRWGKYVMMFVYDSVDPDVGRELRKKNPDPHFLKNHHQWLKKFGRDRVHDQITKVVTIMKLCEDMNGFRRKFSRLFDRQLSFAGFLAE